MTDYGGIGMALRAFGTGMLGGDGGAVVKDYKDALERTQRKEAVQNMLGKMGISGQEKALLDTMDPEAVQAFLANRMQQDYARRNAPGRAPTQAEIELQQIRALAGAFQGTSEAPAPSGGGYSMGEPLDQTIGPRADLSFNVQGELPTAIQATGPTTGGGLSITPTARVPEPTPDLSFGEFARKPTNALEAQIAETQRKYDQAFMLAEQGIPKADHFLKLYGDRLEELKAQLPEEEYRIATPEEAARYGAAHGQFGPDGKFYPLNPPSGMSIEQTPDGGFRFVQGAGVGGDTKFTEVQSKDNVFATRATGALEVLDPIAGELTDRWERLADLDPTGLAREMQTDDFQVAKQAGDEFLQAILRKDTGAAITVPEQSLYGKTYLPQPGDGPAVLQAKQAARARAVAALKSGMSPAQMIAVEKALGEVPVQENTSSGPATDFSAMSQEDISGIDWRSLSPDELKAYDARLDELLK